MGSQKIVVDKVQAQDHDLDIEVQIGSACPL
jgi:hypothetical protein